MRWACKEEEGRTRGYRGPWKDTEARRSRSVVGVDENVIRKRGCELHLWRPLHPIG